jgi:hypothetical protein
MARQYGDVYSWKIVSGTIVVLSSVPAVREILVENSGNVSDRPVSYIADEATWGRSLGFMKYGRLPLVVFLCIVNDGVSGDKWRRYRRCAQEVLNAKACLKHLEIQHAEGTQLMYDILTKPQASFYFSFLEYYSRFQLSELLLRHPEICGVYYRFDHLRSPYSSAYYSRSS